MNFELTDEQRRLLEQLAATLGDGAGRPPDDGDFFRRMTGLEQEGEPSDEERGLWDRIRDAFAS